MKAVYISEPGGPEVLEVREVQAPVAGNKNALSVEIKKNL